MNKQVLLISLQAIIDGSIIEQNIDPKVLSKALQITQETDYRSILGKDLYVSLIDAVYAYANSGTTLDDTYVNLIEASRPYLIARTVWNFITVNNFKISNKGVLKLTDDAAANLTAAELEALKDYYRNVSVTYKADVICHLKDNNLTTSKQDKEITGDGGGWFYDTKPWE